MVRQQSGNQEHYITRNQRFYNYNGYTDKQTKAEKTKEPKVLDNDVLKQTNIRVRGREKVNLLFMSTSAFLQTMFAKRLPIPLIEVRANMIFCFPSTFVLSTRRMC